MALLFEKTGHLSEHWHLRTILVDPGGNKFEAELVPTTPHAIELCFNDSLPGYKFFCQNKLFVVASHRITIPAGGLPYATIQCVELISCAQNKLKFAISSADKQLEACDV
jgi:hypothetical protein